MHGHEATLKEIGSMSALAQDRPYTSEDYWNLPDGERAELIDGELITMATPSRVHQDIVSGLVRILGNYIVNHGVPCRVYPAPFAVDLDADDTTWLEPDVSVICDPAKLTDRGCKGAPDLVVEVVSPTSRQMDYLVKAGRYDHAGVREYWICDPQESQTTVYRFDNQAPYLRTYGFDVPIPVGIWDDALTVTITELL